MRRRRRPFRAFLASTLSVALLTSCPATRGPGPAQPVVVDAPVAEKPSRDIALVTPPEDAPVGLEVRLREAPDQPPAGGAVAAVKAEPLPEAQVTKLLGRLPDLARDPGDARKFALRERSLPPPRPGKTVTQAFPPPAPVAAPEVAEAGPLAVTRAMPEGEVELAPHLAVSFSQPMVAVTSHAELAKVPVPVKLSPQPPGAWRWVGAKTVMFEPEGRFPMATEYTVEVAAGTKSAVGGALAQGKRWTFGTPPPRATETYPRSGPQRLEPVMVVVFDQRVDPRAVLEATSLERAGKPVAIRLASAAEIEADEGARRIVGQAEPGRAVALRAVEPLERASSYQVKVAAGMPSAEGPRRTAAAETYSFYTFRPMAHARSECGWRECRPGDAMQIEFTNPIDEARFDPATVRVEPPIPGMRVSAGGDTIVIHGATKGRTTYTVSIAAGVPDTFGQTSALPVEAKFTTTRAQPTLQGPSRETLVVEPAAGAKLSVFTTNHKKLKARLFAVRPEDYRRFLEHRRDMNCRDGRPLPPPPGRLVATRTIAVADRPDEMVETAIDLTPGLTGGLGHVIAFIEPSKQPRDCYEREYVMAWAQVTRIGLTAFVDHDEMVTWSTDLADGAPLAGVDVAITPAGGAGKSGADGLAVLRLGERGNLLVARKGGDVAFVPENMYYYSQDDDGWYRTGVGRSIRWYVAEDRGLYKPGETARVKGWIRGVGGGEGGDVEATTANQVSWWVRDPQGNEVLKGDAPVTAAGGFDLTLKLPDTMNLGDAQLLLSAEGAMHYHTLRVQEFRRPEYEVKVTASEGPHRVGTAAELTLQANYFAGGGLPAADVQWRVRATPGRFTPPGLDGYAFGFNDDWGWRWWARPSREEARTFEFSGKTDETGQHRVRAEFVWGKPERTWTVVAEGTAQDVNRQQWTGRTTLVVHPADLYVGVKASRPFYNKGDKIPVDVVVADLDGALAPGREATVRAQRLEWQYQRGKWEQKVVDEQTCPVTQASKPGRCEFVAGGGGLHRIEATVTDARGRRSVTRSDLWVAGGDTPPSRDIEQEKAGVVADREEYAAGDVAEILVVSPWRRAEGVMTVRRSGVIRSERFTITDGAAKLRVPIEETHVPNVFVHVDLVGAAPRTRDDGTADPDLPPRPAYAKGSIDLKVPPRRRTLQLTAQPRDVELPPGGETVVDVALRDARGAPVAGGEVAIAVVDEAVLSLTGYRWPDPVATFYVERDDGARDHHLRELLLLAKPELARLGAPPAVSLDGGGGRSRDGGSGSSKDSSRAGPKAAAPMKSLEKSADKKKSKSVDDAFPAEEAEDVSGAEGGEERPIAVRSDFNALALFAAAVPTDSQGKAQVKVKLPDNLTRYRVMAVAAAGANSFGSGEATITAKRPLMVRPSPPRFLNYGDKVELPVVLQNQGRTPLVVDVAVRAGNATLTAGAGRRVTVPAEDRVEVRFPATTKLPGTARFQFAAASGPHDDAAEVALPVWTPATTEAFATYGTLDAGAVAQPVKAPGGVVREFGGLELTTTSTALAGLTDALLYLVNYPFDCAEQVSSRVVAVAALRDVMTAFKAEGLPSPQKIEASMRADLKRLKTLQNWDGGWGFWRWGERSYPYLSIHVAHALARAKAKGYDVPREVLASAQNYLRAIEYRIPSVYGEEVRRVLIAYALYTRRLLGAGDPERARRLIREAGGVEKLPLEAVAWLYSALQGDAGSASELAAIRLLARNRVEETAGAAHFVTSYSDGAHLLLHSDRRVDALMLEALIADQPQSDLIPKLAEGLLAHRKAGRWGSTQENAFVLLALDRYFNTYEKIEPDFVARAWLGPQYAGEQRFVGRQTDRQHIDIPMPEVFKVGAGDLVIAKEGKGRLYYRVGMRYAPSDLVLPPADHGFVVDRVYEGADDPKDVTRDKDGTWRIRAGARVRVRLTMVAPTRRYHVALVDPLPAGLEPQNPALATTGSLPDDPAEAQGGRAGRWWWWRPWYEHQNLRDERAEAFTSMLWEGVHTYTYVALATTPGVFVVPPPKAEEMYHPETFGRGWGAKVIVE